MNKCCFNSIVCRLIKIENAILIILSFLLLCPFNVLSQNVDIESDSILANHSDAIFQLLKIQQWDKASDSLYNLVWTFSYSNKQIPKLDSIVSKVLDYKDSLNIHSLRKSMAIIGYCYTDILNKNKPAKNLYLRANQLLEPRNKGDESWQMEKSLASIFTQEGDYDQAIYYYDFCQKYLNEQKDQSHHLSRLYALYGIAYMNLYQYKKSYQALKEGIKLADGDQQGLAYNYISLANFFNAQKIADSAVYYLQRYEKINKKYKRKYNDEYIKARAEVLRLSNQYFLADSLYYSLVRSKSNPYSRFTAKHLNQKAKNNLKWNKPRQANKDIQLGLHYLNKRIDSLKISNPQTNDMYTENTFTELLTTRKDIYLHLFQQYETISFLDSALQCLWLINHNNMNQRKTLLADQSKLVNIKDNSRVLGETIDLMYMRSIMLNQKLANTKTLDSIRYVFNQSKGLLLSDRRKLRLGLWPPKVRDSIISIKSQLAQLENPTQDQTTNNRMYRHTRKVKLEQKLQSFLSSAPRRSGNNEHADHIEYLVSENEVYALMTFKNKRTFHHIGRKSKVDSLIRTYRLAILEHDDIDHNNEKLKSSLHQLFLVLLGKIPRLPTSFYIIPDGNIHLVNFDLLIKDINDTKYLIETNHITYAYHHGQLLENMTKKEWNNLPLFAMIPQYNSLEPSVKKDVDRGDLYPLVYAKKEIQNIMDIRKNPKDSVIYSGKKMLQQRSSPYKIFHYAGHAVSENQRAYLALSSDENDILNLREIEQMPLSFDLVFLSACETAKGQIVRGEGNYCIGRNFFAAGADHVIQSQWTLNDQSTSKIAADFYKNLNKGLSVSSALREAKLSFYKNASPQLKHPYFWSGLMAYSTSQKTNVSLLEYTPYLTFLILIIFIFISHHQIKNMRLLLFILLTVLTVNLHAQDDHWYILNGKGLDADYNSASNSNGTTINGLHYANHIYTNILLVENVTFPSPPYTTNNETKTPTKNIFIIFEDGDFGSTKLNNTTPSQLEYVHTQPNSGNYLITTNSPVKYMYLTEEYDNDDPRITKTVKSGNNTSTADKDLGSNDFDNNFTGGIWAHSDIVAGDDVVIVIDNFFLKRNCDSSSNLYKICYNINGSESTIDAPLFDNSPLFANNSNVMNGITSKPQTNWINNETQFCTTMELYPGNPSYTYIALRATENVASLQNKEITFTASCAGNSGQFSGSTEAAVHTAHDPNYIEVMNVCEADNGKQYVKYHIEFQNDGNSATSVVDLSLQFPECVLVSNNMEITKWKLGASTSENNPSVDLIDSVEFSNNGIFLTYPNSMTLQHDNNPSDTINPNSIGYIEICLEVDATCDLQSCDLQPTLPHTSFNNNDYPIISYIDPSQAVNYTSCDSEGIPIQTIMNNRPITPAEFCPCPENTSTNPLNTGTLVDLNDLNNAVNSILDNSFNGKYRMTIGYNNNKPQIEVIDNRWCIFDIFKKKDREKKSKK